MAKKVRYTQPLLGVPANNALGYLVLVPGASVLIRQDGVECDVFADNDGAAMTNPVPTGVSPGTAGVDTRGTLVVYLDPGNGYDGVATVGNVASTFAIPDISPDVSDVQGPIPAGTYAGTPTPGVAATALVTTTNQTATGVKKFAGADGSSFAAYEVVGGNPAGIKGSTLRRTVAGGALGISLYTGDVFDWCGLALDYEVAGGPNAGPSMADLVLANHRKPDGTSTDVLRMREGGFLALGNSVSGQRHSRLALASNGTYATAEPSTLKTMLYLEIGDAASGVEHLIRAATPGNIFGVTKAGWVGAGTSTPAAPLHAASPGAATATVGDALRIELAGTGDPGYLSWLQGNGSLNWRLGRSLDLLADLCIFSANGSTTTTPAAPGLEVIRFKRNGDLVLPSTMVIRFGPDVTITRQAANTLSFGEMLSIFTLSGQPVDINCLTQPVRIYGGGSNNVAGFVSRGPLRVHGDASGATLFSGAGAPASAQGANGDLYLRTDGGAGTTIYQKRAGAWVATAA
jgi:hypothetical protein